MARIRSGILVGIKAVMLGLLLTACMANSLNTSSNPYPGATAAASSGPRDAVSTATQQEKVLGASATGIPLQPTQQPTKAVPKSVTNSDKVQPPANGPRLQAKIDAVDYGDVWNGDIVDQTFEFTNVGNQQLVMDKIAVKAVEGC